MTTEKRSPFQKQMYGLSIIAELGGIATMLENNGNKQAADQIRIDCCTLAYALGRSETVEKANEVISMIKKYKTQLQCKH